MKHLIAALLTLSAAISLYGGSVYTMRLELNKKDGYYRNGEQVICSAVLLKNGEPVKGEKLRCTVKKELKATNTVDVVTTGKAMTFSDTMDRPGWIMFSFSVIGKDGKVLKGPTVYRHRMKPTVVGEIGAIFDREKIIAKPGRPADFDKFWEDQLAEMAKMPFDPVIKEVEPWGKTGKKVKCYTIEVKCPGRAPVTGYMAIPIGAKTKTLPIVVDYLSMTWSDASKKIACRTAAVSNAIAFHISWHGMGTGNPPKWYTRNRSWYQLRKGVEEKGKWLPHDMYLRAARACHYAMTRPEWNGRDLVVRGGSLGGIQTIAAAALVPQVTIAMIGVSSGCEFNAHLSGRTPGWVVRSYPELRQNAAAMAALAYYDGVNFAPRIKCETYVSAGFTDERCYPGSIIAFYNNLPGDTVKFLSTDPQGGHYGLTRDKAAAKRLGKGLNSVYVHL